MSVMMKEELSLVGKVEAELLLTSSLSFLSGGLTIHTSFGQQHPTRKILEHPTESSHCPPSVAPASKHDGKQGSCRRGAGIRA